MVRRAIIEVILVPESLKVKPEIIELDILKAIRDGELIIPWCCKVERVKVV